MKTSENVSVPYKNDSLQYFNKRIVKLKSDFNTIFTSHINRAKFATRRRLKLINLTPMSFIITVSSATVFSFLVL